MVVHEDIGLKARVQQYGALDTGGRDQAVLMLPIRAPVPLKHGHASRLMVAVAHDPQPAYQAQQRRDAVHEGALQHCAYMIGPLLVWVLTAVFLCRRPEKAHSSEDTISLPEEAACIVTLPESGSCRQCSPDGHLYAAPWHCAEWWCPRPARNAPALAAQSGSGFPPAGQTELRPVSSQDAASGCQADTLTEQTGLTKHSLHALGCRCNRAGERLGLAASQRTKYAVSSVFGTYVFNLMASSVSCSSGRLLRRLRQMCHWLAAQSDRSPISTTDLDAADVERAGGSGFEKAAALCLCAAK